MIWIDGSKLSQGKIRVTISSRDKSLNSRKEHSVLLEGNNETLDAELWAIANALEVAKKETLNYQNTPITVFSNSQEALNAIQLSFSHPGSPYLGDLAY